MRRARGCVRSSIQRLRRNPGEFVAGDATFKVEVIETTPLPGVDLRLEQIPAPVQTAVSADIEASGALDLSDFLNRRFTACSSTRCRAIRFSPT